MGKTRPTHCNFRERRLVYMNKLCACVLSFGASPRLLEVFDSVAGLPIILFNPTKSWWDEDMPDYTLERLDRRPITIVKEKWKDETEVRNAMVAFANKQGYDFMVMLDADEILDDLNKLKKAMEKGTALAMTCELRDYGPEGEELAQRGHKPVVAVDTREIRRVFYDKRCATGLGTLDGVAIKHYSYDVPEEYEYKIKKQDGDNWPPTEHREVIQ